jgi:2-succinyl-6-hydroxy-2,4-cyclohexadiene-1-carboxylate synthase
VSYRIVLLHGFTQTGAAWEPVSAELRAAGFEALAPDLRGHGRAADVRPVDLAGVMDDLDALVDDAVLAGYSMGGRVALAYAVARPQRVRRLVLVGASPGLGEAGEREARRAADEQLARRIEQGGVEAFARAWAELPLFAGQSEDVAAAVARQRLEQSPAGLAAALRGLGTGALPSLWEALEALEMPVTLVVGERDAKFRAIATEMAVRLPDARVTVVEGAGHAVHLEAPRRLVRELIDS